MGGLGFCWIDPWAAKFRLDGATGFHSDYTDEDRALEAHVKSVIGLASG